MRAAWSCRRHRLPNHARRRHNERSRNPKGEEPASDELSTDSCRRCGARSRLVADRLNRRHEAGVGAGADLVGSATTEPAAHVVQPGRRRRRQCRATRCLCTTFVLARRSSDRGHPSGRRLGIQCRNGVGPSDRRDSRSGKRTDLVVRTAVNSRTGERAVFRASSIARLQTAVDAKSRSAKRPACSPTGRAMDASCSPPTMLLKLSRRVICF